ncbi:MAG: hypothetical protein J0H38_18530 [Rhizobiales bacterium]|jgi:hypothetical protein|nr:hypothetical protein [Hyphomicrobiales bacterium]
MVNPVRQRTFDQHRGTLQAAATAGTCRTTGTGGRRSVHSRHPRQWSVIRTHIVTIGIAEAISRQRNAARLVDKSDDRCARSGITILAIALMSLRFQWSAF